MPITSFSFLSTRSRNKEAARWYTLGSDIGQIYTTIFDVVQCFVQVFTLLDPELWLGIILAQILFSDNFQELNQLDTITEIYL